jgi:hypothetical protein
MFVEATWSAFDDEMLKLAGYGKMLRDAGRKGRLASVGDTSVGRASSREMDAVDNYTSIIDEAEAAGQAEARKNAIPGVAGKALAEADPKILSMGADLFPGNAYMNLPMSPALRLAETENKRILRAFDKQPLTNRPSRSLPLPVQRPLLSGNFAEDGLVIEASISPAAARVYAEQAAKNSAKRKSTPLLERIFPKDPPAATRSLDEQAGRGASSSRDGWDRLASAFADEMRKISGGGLVMPGGRYGKHSERGLPPLQADTVSQDSAGKVTGGMSKLEPSGGFSIKRPSPLDKMESPLRTIDRTASRAKAALTPKPTPTPAAVAKVDK